MPETTEKRIQRPGRVHDPSMTKVGAPRQQKDRGQGCLEKSCEEKRSYDKGKIQHYDTIHVNI